MPHLGGLGQNGHGHRAGVDAALPLCLGNPLYSVNPSFVLQVPVGLWASDAGGRVSKASWKIPELNPFTVLPIYKHLTTISTIFQVFSKNPKIILKNFNSAMTFSVFINLQ